MRKWFLLVLTTVFCCTALAAQVQTRLQKPPMNTLRLKDMWNMTLRNTTAKPITLTLRGTADEAAEGRIVEGRTGQFVLQANESRAFNSDNVPGGGKYSWSSKRFQEAIVRTGSAPSGTYTICVYAEDPTGRQLGMECIQQIVAISQPPILIAPAKNEVLKAGMNPTFIWMQPAPSTPGTIYTLRLVEVFGEQSPIDAMMKNSSVIEQKDLRNTSMQYPPSARKLEVGKRYAWQVSITVDGQRSQSMESSKSEVWTFTYKGDAVPEKTKPPIVPAVVLRQPSGPCAEMKMEITCTSLDSGSYRIAITNSSTSSSREMIPGEMLLHLHKDSVIRFEPSDLVGWTRTPSKFPPATSEMRFTHQKGAIPTGTTVLGTVGVRVGSTSALVFVYEWLNAEGKVLCSDSITLSRSAQYYEAGDEPMQGVTEVPNDVLHVQYINPYASGDPVSIQILDEEDQEVKYAGREPLPRHDNVNGLNRISIPLQHYGLKPETIYVLMISTSTSTRYLRFRVTGDKATNDREK